MATQLNQSTLVPLSILAAAVTVALTVAGLYYSAQSERDVKAMKMENAISSMSSSIDRLAKAVEGLPLESDIRLWVADLRIKNPTLAVPDFHKSN